MSLSVIYYGQQTLTFTDDSLVSLVYKHQADHLYGGLPESTLELVLYSEQELQPQREEKLEVLYLTDVMITQYVTECTRIGRYLYRLTAKTRKEYLQTRFKGNVYDNIDLAKLLKLVFPEQRPSVQTGLGVDTVTGYLSPAARSEVLQQMAFGLGAMVVVGYDGSLRLKTRFEAYPFALDPGKLKSHCTVQYLPVYTGYELASHSYTPGQYVKELRYREEYGENPMELTFSQPYCSFSTDGELNMEILENGSNYVIFTHPGIATIYGTPYLHTTDYHTAAGESAEDPNFSHVMTVRDRTLVGSHNAAVLLQQMQAVGQLRQVVKADYATELGEFIPRVGETVAFTNHLGKRLQGIVTGEVITMTRTHVRTEVTIYCSEVTQDG